MWNWRRISNGKRKTEVWQTDYFILPPIASDGLGYTVYLSNDAIGRQETVNDIKSIKFYRIPYQELVSMSLRANAKQSLEIATSPAAPRDDILRVAHPNPAYYRIGLRTQDVGRTENQTLVLSQSFDPGWIALQKTDAFPYLTLLKEHVLVNNWSNGWILDKSQITNLNDQKNCIGHCDLELVISIFFLPQLLQWFGFLLLPMPFLLLFLKRFQK